VTRHLANGYWMHDVDREIICIISLSTSFLLVDTGAEVSLMHPRMEAKLKGAHMRKLVRGDITGIKLAAGDDVTPVTSVAVLWVIFGEQQYKHEFLVADINTPAILGSDFHGTHGSTVSFSDMSFYPDGNPEHAVKLVELRRQDNKSAASTFNYQVASLCTTTQVAVPTSRSRTFVVAEDTILMPHGVTVIEGVVTPPFSGDFTYEAVIEAADGTLKNKGLLVAAAVTEINAGAAVFTTVCNGLNTPVLLPAGTILATITQTAVNTTYQAVSSTEEAHQAVFQARGCAANTAHVSSATSPNSAAPAESDAVKEEVSDEDTEQLLFDDGDLAAALQGNDEDGIPKVDKAREMLRANKAAICKDPKNPPVTHLMEFDVDTGNARPISEGKKIW
jgi:hypothetical protein